MVHSSWRITPQHDMENYSHCHRKKEAESNVSFYSIFLWLAPAFPVAFTSIAWTHYSERYLYIPGIFFMTGAAYAITTLAKKAAWTKPWVTTLVLLILLQFLSADISHSRVWQNSIALSRNIIKSNPGRPLPYEVLGVFYFSEGKFNEAKKMLKMAVTLGSEHIPLHYLGVMALKSGDEEKGIALLKKSFNPSGSNMDYFRTMGDYYLDKSGKNASVDANFREALKYYKAAYKEKQSDPAILYRLSIANYKAENFKAADKYAKELLLLFPESVWAYAAKKYIRNYPEILKI